MPGRIAAWPCGVSWPTWKDKNRRSVRSWVSSVLGDLMIDYAQRLVTVASHPVQLTATEYRLLFELSVNAGRVLTHDQLLRRVWGPKKPGDIRALRTHVRRVRQKLGEDGNNPTRTFAEARVGYRMPKAEVPDNPAA